MFRHTSSRDLDPQLHTHSVIINATQRNDGNWRALSSRSKNDLANVGHGFRENIYANQHLLGMIYMSELAKGTVEIGHEIEIKDKYGNFEIKGFDQAYLKSQSKRRENILKTMDEKGLSGAKSAQYVCLGDRKTKEAVKPETLQEYWLQDAKAQGINFADIYKKSLDNSNSKTKGTITQSSSVSKPISLEAKVAVQQAIKHLSQYNVKLTHADIIKQAFEFAGYSVDYTSMEQTISHMLKSGELKGKADEYYTTKSLLESEKTFKAQVEVLSQTQKMVDILYRALCSGCNYAASE